MELDFLGDAQKQDKTIKKEETKVSTGKSRASELSKFGCDKPYVKRAVEFAESNGFSVINDVKEAVKERKKGNRVCSFHEADILLRARVGSNIEFILLALKGFNSYLTEDDPQLTQETFILRARFNKGLHWSKTKRENNSLEKQIEGDNRLKEIEMRLAILDLPLHNEEKQEGFDREFLKPEWMTWMQFQIASANTAKFKTIENKKEYAAIGEQIKELIPGA